VTHDYDGDGQQVRYQRNASYAPDNLVRYRLYSTVLGQVLTEVDSAGQKVETYVRTLPTETVRQVTAYTAQTGQQNPPTYPEMIVSEHRDPHGTRLRNWDRNANTFKETHLAGAAVTMDAIDWGSLKTRFVSNIQNQVAYAVSQAHYPGPAGGMKENPNDPANVTIDGQKVKFEDFVRGLRGGSLDIKSIALLSGSFSGGGITITRGQRVVKEKKEYDESENEITTRYWKDTIGIVDMADLSIQRTTKLRVFSTVENVTPQDIKDAYKSLKKGCQEFFNLFDKALVNKLNAYIDKLKIINMTSSTQANSKIGNTPFPFSRETYQQYVERTARNDLIDVKNVGAQVVFYKELGDNKVNAQEYNTVLLMSGFYDPNSFDSDGVTRSGGVGEEQRNVLVHESIHAFTQLTDLGLAIAWGLKDKGYNVKNSSAAVQEFIRNDCQPKK
jgi:hypothetical protein